MRKLTIIFIALALASCTRRDLTDVACDIEKESALVSVSVDWSVSGFDLSGDSRSADYIHRVSFRFFPKDGSAPFDRYLEGNVTSGQIYVPYGAYSVIVFNESIEDKYWEDAIEFENVDDYENFSARLVEEDRDNHPYFDLSQAERLSREALKLASMSIDHFVVTPAMSSVDTRALSEEDVKMLAKVNPVVPRPLTCQTTISAKVENLKSAYIVRAWLSGLSHRVNMASGVTHDESTHHVVELRDREWSDAEQNHGSISATRLTFSAPESDSEHTVGLDVILIDGSRHKPDEPLIFDVTDQIRAPLTRYADSPLGASVEFSLPKVSGTIEVEGWDDDEQITIL